MGSPLYQDYDDLESGQVSTEQIRCADLDDCMGGIARGFKVLEEYPTEEAYSPESVLLMTLGVLSGTQFMTGLRTYFLAYSPLKRSKSGRPSAMWSAGSGKFGTKLRFLGIDEFLFFGRADTRGVTDGHIGSSGGQLNRRRASDASRTPGHQGNTPLEFAAHSV